MCPQRLTEPQKATRMKIPNYFWEKFKKIVDKSRTSELLTVDETWIYSGCEKTKLRAKSAEKVSYALARNSDWPIVQVLSSKAQKISGKFYKNNVLSKMNKRTWEKQTCNRF